jgi:hypothetical protein
MGKHTNGTISKTCDSPFACDELRVRFLLVTSLKQEKLFSLSAY